MTEEREMNLALPALEEFQPVQLPEACWKILQACDLEPLEEFEGINIAENRERVNEKMKEIEIKSNRKGLCGVPRPGRHTHIMVQCFRQTLPERFASATRSKNTEASLTLRY
jgi:hypothetical protein